MKVNLFSPSGFRVMEAFAALQRAIDEESGDSDDFGRYMRPGESEGGEESDPEEALRAEETDYAEQDKVQFVTEEEQEEVSEGEYDLVPGTGYDMFPGRQTFTLEELGDGDDPRFARGFAIGLPLEKAVRRSPDQGKQLPMAGLGQLLRLLKGF